jgi:hypothetical protein
MHSIWSVKRRAEGVETAGTERAGVPGYNSAVECGSGGAGIRSGLAPRWAVPLAV